MKHILMRNQPDPVSSFILKSINIRSLAWIIMIIVFSATTIGGQPLTGDEQRKIKENILRDCPCLFEMEMVYKSKKQEEERQKMSYYFSDMGIAIDNQEMISGSFNDGSFYIDKLNREIYLFNTNQNMIDLTKQQSFKQLMDMEIKGLIKKKEAGLYYVQMINHTGEVFKSKVYFDEHYNIIRAVMDLADIDISNGENKPNGDQITIHYGKKITGKNAVPPLLKKYVVKKGNTWVPAKAYSSYKLIIQ